MLKNHSLQEHAIAYGAAGWPVLPLKQREKIPLTRHGAKDATTDAGSIRDWWRRWPFANIGIAVPPGFLVIDIDSEGSLIRLQSEFGNFPETVRAKTAKGWHLWFSTDAVVGNHVGVREGIDTRAAGGYLVVPPSIHPSGHSYRWEIELDRRQIAIAPQWAVCLAGVKSPGRTAVQGDVHDQDWRRRILEPVLEGCRNQSLAQVAGLLFRVLPAEIASELAWCWAKVKTSPPLPDQEIFRTLDSIAGRELNRRSRP